MKSLFMQLCTFVFFYSVPNHEISNEDTAITTEMPHFTSINLKQLSVEHDAILTAFPQVNTEIVAVLGSRKKVARTLGVTKARPVKSFRGSSIQQDLQYYNGFVFTGPAVVYCIWYGDWSGALGESSSPAAQTIMTDFISNVGGSNWLGIAGQYSQIPTTLIYGGSTDMTYLTDASGATNKVMTMVDLDKIIADAVIKLNAPANDNDIYMVIVSEDVTENEGFCLQYCAYHSAVSIGQRTIQTSFIGNCAQCLANCGQFATGSINGIAAADAMVNHIGHEIAEVITDPCDSTGSYNGWKDNNTEEIADKCEFSFGETYNSGTANIRLGSRDYLIQQLWTNTVGGIEGHCVMHL